MLSSSFLLFQGSGAPRLWLLVMGLSGEALYLSHCGSFGLCHLSAVQMWLWRNRRLDPWAGLWHPSLCLDVRPSDCGIALHRARPFLRVVPRETREAHKLLTEFLHEYFPVNHRPFSRKMWSAPGCMLKMPSARRMKV